MKEFKVMKQDNELLCVRMYSGKGTIIDFTILKKQGEWSYEAYVPHNNKSLNAWTFFELKENKFIPKEKEVSKESIEETNKNFYELLRYLKSHPILRLKVLNILNNDIRKIWHLV